MKQKTINTELAVILNSYNRLSLLQESLSSLIEALNKTTLSYGIVVFEAGSTDGSLEWIRDFFEKNKNIRTYLMLASPGKPNSFSHGVNAACNYALKNFSSLKYLFLYETDNVLLTPETLMSALELLKEKNHIAGCGFTVKKHNGSNAGFGSRFPSIISLLLGQQLSFKLRLHEPKIQWLSLKNIKYTFSDVVYTSPMLIKAESWQVVSGFDADRFPFSDCDIDLAYRLSKEKMKLAVIQTTQVIHDNLEIESSWSATRTIRFYRSRFTYFKKHVGNTIHLLKPFLFVTHIIEFTLLVSLVILKKRKTGSLKTRWFLITHVFSDYK